jgi:hypothetical protein
MHVPEPQGALAAGQSGSAINSMVVVSALCADVEPEARRYTKLGHCRASDAPDIAPSFIYVRRTPKKDIRFQFFAIALG